MERLTRKDAYGFVQHPWEFNGVNGSYDIWDEELLAKQIDRLAAYEDTGLEPDVCAEYKKFEDEAVSKGVPFKRIVELMNAQQEGKLVALPCKVGDTVYVIGESCDFCETYLDEPERCMRCEKGNYVEERGFELWMLSELNESIFLNREEAEAALKGGEGISE